MAGERILVVEDQRDIVKLLRFNLEKEGYKVSAAYDGEAGLEAFRTEKPDLVILDLMLPRLNGMDFCRLVRQDSAVPILILTAKKEEMDRVLGLELGADDYVTKPFSVREVAARVKAILRRAAAPAEAGAAALKAGQLELDPGRYEVRLRGKALALSTKEFDLLKFFMASKGLALTREQILSGVWGYGPGLEIETRTVDQHIARLREKLGEEARRVVTVKNVGYRFDLE